MFWNGPIGFSRGKVEAVADWEALSVVSSKPSRRLAGLVQAFRLRMAEWTLQGQSILRNLGAIGCPLAEVGRKLIERGFQYGYAKDETLTSDGAEVVLDPARVSVGTLQGDCEDLTFLALATFAAAGEKGVVIAYPSAEACRHVAAGVMVDGEPWVLDLVRPQRWESLTKPQPSTFGVVKCW